MPLSLRLLARYLYKLGESMILLIEFMVIIATTAMTLFAAYYLVRDLSNLTLGSSIQELQILINDVFMLIIFAEIMRSIIVSHRRPETYIVGIAEVGFVVTIREIFVSILTKTTFDLVLSSIAAVVMAVALWILRSKVIVSR